MNVVVDMRKSGRKEMIEGCITLFIKELKLEKSKASLFVFSRKNFEKERTPVNIPLKNLEPVIEPKLN